MPGYREGYKDGFRDGQEYATIAPDPVTGAFRRFPVKYTGSRASRTPVKRKLSAWNKFVKANSKKPRFIYRNGKLNLKKMGVAFRKTPAGRKKK